MQHDVAATAAIRLGIESENRIMRDFRRSFKRWGKVPPIALLLVGVGLFHGDASSARNVVVESKTNGCVRGEWDPELQDYPCVSPIVVQVGPRKPYTFTSADDGVVFDIDGDGWYDRVAWTDSDSDTAFLALDRNGNGYIDGGRELIGEYFYRNNQESGFDALLRLKKNEHRTPQSSEDETSVTALDGFYHRLVLWTDRNHNGVSEPSEMEPLSTYITNVQMWHATPNKWDEFGNNLKYSTSAQRRGQAAGEPWATIYAVFLKADLGKDKKQR
jgi:hypothetical protein